MPQKLSAMKYIQNNKRRVAVLIVSLFLSFLLTYLSQFLLSVTVETFRPITIEYTKKIQYVFLAGSSFGLDVDNMNDEALEEAYTRENLALTERLKTYEGIEAVYYAQVIYAPLRPLIGNMTFEIPLTEQENIPAFLEHMDAALSSGRLPENAGEIVLDDATMKNNGYKLNDFFYEEIYGTAFQIVGILDCGSYFGCGIPSSQYTGNKWIISLSDGSIEDFSALLRREGISVRENYDTVFDLKWAKEFMKTEVTDAIGNSTDIIYISILILLSVALIIVYTIYLRDRHNEWCLYCSIGYSRRTIYFSILRELFFTFTAALLLGAAVISVSVVILDYTLITPLGLKCRYFYPETLMEILCSYVLIFGILQIPIRYALYKIRTIDAIEDDLY